ncbi:MAG: alanine racemase [Elusimicrobia bacterium]|nr:alanine racemase [Elusimicrobiota bacterium]
MSVSPRRFFRPTWAEIDLRALQGNLRAFRARIPSGPKLLFVVKADAYGHGAPIVARAAERVPGVDWLGVSSVEEGVSLRQAGVRLPILILGSVYPFESLREALRHRLTPTIASIEAARELSEICLRSRAARTPCHVKLDTGMGRIGMGWPSGLELARFIASEPSLYLEGVYTHLARANDDAEFTRLQLERFRSALEDMRREGMAAPIAHAANSAAALRFPASRFGMVRPGLAIYGLYPRFRPVMSLKSRIVFIKNVGMGASIGYGRTFRARRPSRIATLPIGYGDGFPRALSNRAGVLVRGRRCQVVGAISMDMTTVDVTGVAGARVGDEAVLMGRQDALEIDADALAQWAGTISYEIVTRIATRVPRVYLK